MDLTLILIIGLVSLVLLALVTYFIIFSINRKKIKILLSSYNFKEGDKISGKILIQKDMTEVNELSVGITCYLQERNYWNNFGRNGGSSTTKRRRIFDLFEPLKISSSLNKGDEIPFEITLPNDVANKIQNNVAKAALGVLSVVTGYRQSYEWFVEAKVDKKGLDISNWQKIFVN